MKSQEFKDNRGRRALVSAIMSTKFLSNLAQAWTPNGLFSTQWENLVANWCVEYYKDYGKAPKKHIQGIFQNWEEKNEESAIADIVQKFLFGLSEEYEETNGKINSKYEIEQAKPYFLENETKQLIEKLQGAIDTKKHENIETTIKEWRAPTLGVDSEDIHLFNDPKTWECMFKEKEDILIKYPGALGEFYGYELARGNFITFLAPEKRGKCVSGNMLVKLADGSQKPIKEMVEKRIETPIVSFNEKTLRFEPVKVSDFWTNGEKICFGIETKSGRYVETTSNHKYLTPTGWKYLSEIKVGDSIAVPKEVIFLLLRKENILWDEIAKITPVGIKKTYDLTVSKYHNFVCNDCIVHNSWLLIDIAFMALKNRRRVAYFQNGDLTRAQISRRFASRVCRHPWRKREVTVPVRMSVDKNWDVSLDYKSENFKQDLQLRMLENGFKEFRETIKSEKNLFKMRVYPASSLTIQHLRNIVAMWARDGWVADVVVIDYADILSPSPGKGDPREKINEIWIGLRALSQTMNCLVVTATQANRASYNVKNIGMEHTSEDKRKQAHVTGVIAINQTVEEKKKQVMRLGWTALREDDYSVDSEVYIAGCLSLANPAIISCLKRPPKEEDKKEDDNG